MAKKNSSKPVQELTYWPVRVSVWRNEDGEGRLWYTTTVKRVYKKDDEEWDSTHSLDVTDLLPAAKALEEAFGVIQRLLTEDRKAATAA